MELITLEPRVWTLVAATTAIQARSNPSGLRIHYADEEPPVETEVYFTVPDYELAPFRLPGTPRGFDAGTNVYMMPDGDEPAVIVSL
ncbi:hypothetical protein ASF03_02245 [Rhizobium sp. Leaf68]|nr:hypothetical protein ASE62_02090 [Rhizobium sp. Leaf202]KQN87823.1 hypothetical protein ASF03_02245 [Rhizobium sp. Leaf68]